MTETNWGRKETIIWPPHSPIYTFGAIFLGFVLTGLFVYLRFAFALSPLEQFYLPLYIKTSIAPSFRSSGQYQMLLISDSKGRAWYAREVDVAAGSTPQARCQAHPSRAIRLRSPARHDLSLPQRSEHLQKQRS